MERKTKIKVMLLLLCCLIGVSACKAGGEKSLTEEELFSAACEALACSPEEWRGVFPETEAKEAVLLLLPAGAKAEMTGAYAGISMRTQDVGYLVALDRTTGEVVGETVTECGISQMGVSFAKGKTWVGLVYRDAAAGWEEYGMKQYCFDGTDWTRLCSEGEAADLYIWWKDRKPVLNADGTIEIYKRKAEAGAFEALVQNRDLKGFDHYEDYVAAYTWEPEQTGTVSKWAEACVPYEASGGKSGPELIRDIFLAEAAGTLPEELYFSVGYDGALVTDYVREDSNRYFIIKKYGGAHQAGFQSLCMGSLDQTGKIVQCRLYMGDRAQAAVVETEAGREILFCTETEYNGILSAAGGILRAEDGSLTWLWPLTEAGEPDEDYWNRRTARIKGNQLEVYRVEYQENEIGTIGGYELWPEEVKSAG